MRELMRGSVLVKTIALLVAVEVSVGLLLPAIAPAELYVRWYLKPEAEASIDEFLEGRALLVPDEATGWRSAGGANRGQWRTEASGARNSTRSDFSENALSVVALGSSMVNGGAGVANDETLTAFIESDSLRVDNFATMMFGLDQSALMYWSHLSNRPIDVVVVGVDADVTDAVVNTFIPLRRPEEYNVAFLKPRFELVDGTLRLVPIDPETARDPEALAEHVLQHDGYAWRLGLFRLGRTPLLGAFQWAASKAASLRRRYAPPSEGTELFTSILDSLRVSVEARGADLVVVAMPPGLGDLNGGLPFEPDLHAARVEAIRGLGLPVIDSREVLLEASIPLSDLYTRDRGHLSAVGNEAVGRHVQDTIQQIRRARQEGRRP